MPIVGIPCPSEQLSLERTDSFVGDIAVEAFTCLLIFKNIFSFGLTWGAYHWLVQGGILKVFYVIASVQVGICLLSIPMCKLAQNTSHVFPIVIRADSLCRHFGKEKQGFLQSARLVKDDASLVKNDISDNSLILSKQRT